MALAAFLDERQESNPMITCQEFFAEFGDYLENRVSPDVLKELVQHMASAALGHMQFEFHQDLWLHAILEIVSAISEEFLARNHAVNLLTHIAECGESNS